MFFSRLIDCHHYFRVNLWNLSCTLTVSIFSVQRSGVLFNSNTFDCSLPFAVFGVKWEPMSMLQTSSVKQKLNVVQHTIEKSAAADIIQKQKNIE